MLRYDYCCCAEAKVLGSNSHELRLNLVVPDAPLFWTEGVEIPGICRSHPSSWGSQPQMTMVTMSSLQIFSQILVFLQLSGTTATTTMSGWFSLLACV